MRFCTEALLPHPLPAVYRVYRDAFDVVANRVENIERVEVFDIRPFAGGLFHRHRWQARVSIPLMARGTLTPEMLCWQAEVTWRDAQTACDWRIRAQSFPEQVQCRGRVELCPVDARRTRAVFHGELTVDLTGVSLIPRRVQGLVADRVTRFILARIPGTFVGVAEAVSAHLEGAGQPSSAPLGEPVPFRPPVPVG